MLCLPYYAYVFSSTKLEIRAEQVLPGSQEGGGQREGSGKQWRKMAHVNKCIKKKRSPCPRLSGSQIHLAKPKRKLKLYLNKTFPN
jgi:hypothetical protein